jgi:hypothetical protein
MSSSLNSTLTPNSSSGDQATTQDPQAATSTTALSGQAEDVQTGTAASLLTSDNGIPLNATTTASTVSTSPHYVAMSTHNHTVNPVLLVFVIILFIAAVGSFIGMSRSAKNTTK